MVTGLIVELFNQKMKFCNTTVTNLLRPDYHKGDKPIGTVTHAYALSIVSSPSINIIVLYNFRQIFEAAVNKFRMDLADLPPEATEGFRGDMTPRSLAAEALDGTKFKFFVGILTALEKSVEWGAKILATREQLNEMVFDCT